MCALELLMARADAKDAPVVVYSLPSALLSHALQRLNDDFSDAIDQNSEHKATFLPPNAETRLDKCRRARMAYCHSSTVSYLTVEPLRWSAPPLIFGLQNMSGP